MPSCPGRAPLPCRPLEGRATPRLLLREPPAEHPFFAELRDIERRGPWIGHDSRGSGAQCCSALNLGQAKPVRVSATGEAEDHTARGVNQRRVAVEDGPTIDLQRFSELIP